MKKMYLSVETLTKLMKLVENDATTEEFTRNQHGVQIRKCCASCQHKMYSDDDELRCCALTNCEHLRCHLCEDWRLARGFKKAGNSGGMIKRVEYLEFLADIRAKETKDEQRSIEDIRAEFEKEHGSIYLKF